MKITKAIVLGLLLMIGLAGLASGREMRSTNRSDLNLTASNGENASNAMQPRHKHRRKQYRRRRGKHRRKHAM